MVGPTEKALTPEAMQELESVVRGEGPFEEGDPKEIKRLVEQAEAVGQKHDEGPFEANNQRLAELEAEVGAVEQRALIPEGREPPGQLIHDDLESGVAIIDTNNGDGTYVVTKATWDGTAWQAVASGHSLYQVAARDKNGRLNGAGDYVIYWEMIKADGSTEIVIDRTTTILWADVTNIAALPLGVEAQQCVSEFHEGTGSVITIGLYSPLAAADSWLQPDVAVDDRIVYCQMGDEYRAVGIKWKHTGPDTSDVLDLDTSCEAVHLRFDKRGHLVHYSADGVTWYDLEGNAV